MKKKIKSFFCFLIMVGSFKNILIAQPEKTKDKDLKKENEKFIGKPGKNYNYLSGTSRYNPKTGKYETVEGEWKKQPDEFQYDPKEWSKPKHKSRVYGKNPLRRLFKIKPKGEKGKQAPVPSDKKETPFTTGEGKEKE